METASLAGLSRLGRFRWPTLALVVVAGFIGGVLPPRYGAAFMVGSATALATLVNPAIGLAALAFAVPFGTSGSTTSRLPITPTDALVMLILVAAVAAWWSARRDYLVLTEAFWPGIAFILVATLSATFVPEVATSAKEILRWVELLGVLIVAATFCQRWEMRRLVIAALLSALTLEALLGWAQFFLRRGPPSFRIGPFLRAYGTFGQPNPFGGYLEMLLPVALAIVYTQRPWAKRPDWLTTLAIIASAIGGVALLMSLSRGAWFGLAAGITVLLAVETRRGVTVAFAGVVALGALLVLDDLHVVPGVISHRLAQVVTYFGVFDVSHVVPTPQNWAIIERMAHWQAAWNMYQAYPILGVGPGHYPIAYPTFRVNDIWKASLGHAHNIYLNVLAEEGFVGLVAYLAQIVAWLVVILAGRRRAVTPVDRALVAGVLASFVAVAVHNMVDDLYVHGLNAQLGLLIGLAAAIGVNQIRGQSVES